MMGNPMARNLLKAGHDQLKAKFCMAKKATSKQKR